MKWYEWRERGSKVGIDERGISGSMWWWNGEVEKGEDGAVTAL